MNNQQLTHPKHCFSEKENQNDSADIQCNGPSHVNKVSDGIVQKPVAPAQPKSSMRAPLTQRGNLPTENEVKNDLKVQQVDTMSMMDQLAQELGKMY